MHAQPAYSRISDGETFTDGTTKYEHDTDLQFLENDQIRMQPGRLKRHLPWIAHGTSVLICLGILMYTATIHHNSRRSCIERFNAYSPLLEAIDQDYHDVRFKYSLWYKSPYKGPPTPQVDRAWHDLMQYGQISVTADDIVRIGHNLSSVRYPESAGGGYLATAMGTHAIHCLHYIWQDHYMEVLPDVKTTKENIPEMYERHYEHCVDYIRQYLMCKFDTTIMPFNWVLDHQNPTPNGNTIHKCVNWDFLQDWLKKRAVQVPEGFKWHQPADAVTLDWNP